MWAVLSALYPAEKHADRTSKYEKYIENHDWSMLDFPVPVNQIAKFEERNNLSINVYGWDGAPHLLHKSKQHSAPQHINLLLVEAKYASHYCWIKHFSRFACVGSDQKNGKREYCRYCLKAFDATHLNKKDPKYRTAQQRLDEHLKMGCREITEVTPELPDPQCVDPMDRLCRFSEFKHHFKQLRVPFVIYADFEALTKPVEPKDFDSAKSYTQEKQDQVACSYCYHIVALDGHRLRNPKPRLYRGPDAVKHFIQSMKKDGKTLENLLKREAPMKLTQSDELSFAHASQCYLCKKPFEGQKNRDHCHLTGKYRGAACSNCNLEEGKDRTKNISIEVLYK